MKKLLIISLMSFLLFVVAAPVYSELIDRGSGLIYDTGRNMTWLQDANMGGFKNWYDALDWADDLVFGGFEDWRLPSAVPSPDGVNVITYDWTDSEMGHLYYTELGNEAAYGGPAPPINPGPFTNLPNAFWSGTGADGPFAWTFNFSGGGQNGGLVSSNLLGSWAVRDGDVIPHTYCVSTSAELQDALNVAATNSTPDIIRIRSSVDPYVGNFVYTSTEPYGLTIEGGYNSDCTARVVDYTNTVLDGGGIGIVLLLSTPDDPAKFIVEGITSQNGYPQPSLQVITDYGEVTLNNNNISNNPRGGVYLSKIDKVTLNNNNISNNNYGGGIHLEYINTVTLNENIINNNDRIGGHVQYGGGIFGDSAGDVSLTNNTITNNSADKGKGGGVYFTSSEIVTFTNNNISNNICESSGGGVYVRDAAEVNLVNNIINNNISTTAGGGGAILSGIGTSILTKNLISNNSAQSGGGASIGGWGTAILTNNTIINNSVSQSSSGVALTADTVILTNNTISNNSADNSAGSYGGGVKLSFRESGIAIIYNNIIWNNNVPVGRSGADLYIDNDTDRDGFANGTVNLYNNDFDLSNGFYIEVDDSSVVYSNNLDNEDPKFDVDGYHLTKDSPCIDAGVNAGVYDDIDGDSRPQGAAYDIGADEYVISDSDGDGIPDTGQTQSYTNTFGEDSDYTINPPSYTLNLNPDGSIDGTTTDDITGLMWQSSDDNNFYNWYEASGTPDATSNPDGTVNVCGDLSLAGYTDWRLPTVKELQGIVNYDLYFPSIDQTAFPGTNSDHHWSSTLNGQSATSAWDVNFKHGAVYGDSTSLKVSFVRCVRDGQQNNQAFINNDDGTVTDAVTGLTWQQEDDNATRTWEEAITYCEDLELPVGQNDWRLPNIKELLSIVDNSQIGLGPAIDPNYFLETNLDLYWSSTSGANYPTLAWAVHFQYGQVGAVNGGWDKILNYYARCVRGPDSAGDTDGDGIPDNEDACPDSNLTDTVLIDGWDSGVENVLLEDGCTISDLISQCADEADNHGEFVSSVSHTTNSLKKEGIISGKEKGRIQKGAATADIP